MPRLSKIGAAALAAFGWTGLSSVTVSYLVVAGGGGGGTDNVAGLQGGGGGAGGFLSGTASLNPTQSYTVTVGAGGSGGSSGGSGSNASNSLITGIATAIGGGGGGSYLSNAGGSGGSGGGGAPTPAGTSTVGQGNNGGTGTVSPNGGGGGGGAGAVGGSTTTPNGGVGLANPITGSTVGQLNSGTYYLAGGGGGRNGSSPNNSGTGGLGGGGTFGGGGAGTANTGGGAGGTGGGTAGSGGSGVVIISYVGAQQFGGGVVTSSGGNTIHTFNTSGTLSPLSSLTASYLIVAGGGGGGASRTNAASGSGGGAGGLLSGSGVTIDTNSIYLVTVGSGGSGGIAGGTSGGTGNGVQGGSSAFSMVTTTAVGGGFGACGGTQNGGAGGSGGGGTGGGNFGAGTSGQGNDGGRGPNYPSPEGLGGGGGAGAAGGNSSGGGGSNVGGTGGVGVSSSISGTATFYAGGGGGGGDVTAGAGGNGGGGAGGGPAVAGTSGTANLGGGGGGSNGNGGQGAGGNGGAGVVIISYSGSVQQMAGGTVTVAGGNVIHTFTSSGFLTPIVLVTNSLRFRSSASASLSRTPTTASNRTTWTWSGWVKRAEITTTERTFFSAGIDNNNFTALAWYNDSLYFQNYTSATQTITNTTAVFRDPSAWYHIVLAIDTTQATAANRAKIYVNGVQQAGFSGTPFSSSQQFWINFTYGHRIGSRQLASADSFSEQYMTEINFIDGQALTPFSFGTTSDLGVWQPIRYGGSYGTNGFYLPFTATQSFTGIFSGSSQWISVPNLAAYSVGTNNYTVEGWFYITSLGSTQGLWGSNNGSGATPKFLGLVNTSGAVLLEFTNSGGATFLTSSSGVVTTNKWHHIAWVRNSGTSTIYVNGVNVGSTATSVNLAGLTQAWNIGYIGEAGPSSLTGNASNFRLVTGTAVYTSNFIPQTTALTAISGTQILTLQNATLVDNSTNAQVVTNNGGVTVGATYPFAMLNDVVKDFGPAGNNWTANNIGETTGSTLDTMTDVPTLTSATTANYATINPLDYNSTYLTLSAANLQQTYAGVSAAAASRATMVIPTTGKFYWEVYINATGGGSGERIRVGITSPTTAISGNSIDSSPTSYLQMSNGQKRTGTTDSTYGAGFSATQYIQVLYDATAGAIYFGQNNSFANGTGSFNQTFSTATAAFTGLSGEFMPCFITYGGADIAVNFGQQPFSYTPPTGFVALNTFNLPTPTIGATASTQAGDFFDVSLYTGTGATQTITNLGSMQPDFIWIKSRSSADYHQVFDSVRGISGSGSPSLITNLTDAEANYGPTFGVTAVTSTGFTVVGNGSFTNGSGISYVAWQWRASNATAVTNTQGSITSTVSANTTAGFSIVTYTGTGVNATVGHGLGVVPSLYVVKRRNNVDAWFVYSNQLAATQYLRLNSTNAAATFNFWQNTAPTSSVFYISTDVSVNASSDTYVAYCFAQVAGYSAFGSYTGNGSSDGPFVFTGFRPRYVLIKSTIEASNWLQYDTARMTFNKMDTLLYPSLSNAEGTDSTYAIDILSNGFKIRGTGQFGGLNNSGNSYIYMAFAESPLKFANAR